ncbi:MAG: UDP-N-acetylmuramoyl-L-alanine--D-glutamate ligase [Bacteroidetes bacterium]|nr:UDP-N-acetylmuramoyl-L-alanine--D-glutamate ligase [Bacteroidota bacterium]
MKKKIVILGSGESGVGAAILAMRQGFEVFVSDNNLIHENYKNELAQYAIPFEEGGHDEARILSADELIKSPGIPDKIPLLQKVKAKNIPVISEIEWAFRYKNNSQIIAITGSNGKTTTTSLIFHICIKAGLDAALVGNIGKSFARQVALDPKPYYIVEISSFQLDGIKNFKADTAVLMNITEDHLDRYDYKFENYINSKFKILQNQDATNYFVFNADDEVIQKKLEKISPLSNPLPFSMKHEIKKGAYISQDQMLLNVREERFNMSIYDFALKGKHNQYNTMAAGIAAATIGIRKEKIREAIKDFQSLEHRMEYVATIRGIEFINDSKATNVNSTWYALESMQKPVVLILGGVDKGNDYQLIKDLVREKVIGIVCLGKDNKKIHESFEAIVPVMIDTDNTPDAVKIAYQIASKDSIVLLSPACASFDLFKNYEDRGNQFREAVKNL